MWEKGEQPNRMTYSSWEFNEEMLRDKRYLQTEEAKVTLYQFLRKNPGFASQLLLGVRLYPYQVLMLKGMMTGDYSMYIISRGGSKSFIAGVYTILECILNQGIQIGVLSSSFRQCLSPDALVLTENGIKEMRDISVGDKVMSINGTNTILNKWENEESATIKITTKKGYEIEGKPHHKILIFNPRTTEFEWCKIKHLKEKQYVPMQRGNNLWGKNKLKLDHAYIYGLTLGDGYVSKNNRITITSNDQESLDLLARYKFKVFPKTDSNCSYARNSYNYFQADPLYLCKKTATYKHIPKSILNSNKETISNFLSGLFDSDGYCNVNTEIAFCTSSKRLAKEVHCLLLNFGIISKLSIEKGRGKIKICGNDCIGRESYKIRITNFINIHLFNKYIGFRLTRKRKLAEKLESNSQWGCYDNVPDLQHYIRNKYKKCVKGGNLQKHWRGMSYDRIKKFLQDNPDMQDETILDIQDYNYYYDTIDKIEVSHNTTYDIEVENEHCYHANGFINHNSKIILQKAEDILQKPGAKLAKDCFTNKKFITKGTDMWQMQIGQSRAIALPLANGQLLRGFRFQQILIDEFLNIPKNVFNEVIMPFLSVIPNPTEREDLDHLENSLIERGEMKQEDKYQWPNNKLILLSSPSFKFEYMYELYKIFVSLILEKQKNQFDESEAGINDAYRVVMQLAYDVLPPQIHDKNLLAQSKSTMSEMQFKREFGAQFIDESDGYFRLSKMAACTIEEGQLPCVEVKGSPADEYILSFDPNWASNSSADHFAMHVFKILKEDQKLVLVHSYAIAGVDLKQHQKYFLYILKHFNIVGICGDYNGGVQFLEAWNESALSKDHNLNISTIDVKLDDPKEYEEDLREFKRQYNKGTKCICILRKPSTTWIREANERLQADIDHKRILFAAKDPELSQKGARIGIKDLKWDLHTVQPKEEVAMMVNFIDMQYENIEMTKNQCANIEVRSNPQGSQTFDLPQHLKRQTGPHRARKDSYSALVLGNWFGRVYFDQLFLGEEKQVESTFTPMIIG